MTFQLKQALDVQKKFKNGDFVLTHLKKYNLVRLVLKEHNTNTEISLSKARELVNLGAVADTDLRWLDITAYELITLFLKEGQPLSVHGVYQTFLLQQLALRAGLSRAPIGKGDLLKYHYGTVQNYKIYLGRVSRDPFNLPLPKVDPHQVNNVYTYVGQDLLEIQNHFYNLWGSVPQSVDCFENCTRLRVNLTEKSQVWLPEHLAISFADAS